MDYFVFYLELGTIVIVRYKVRDQKDHLPNIKLN